MITRNFWRRTTPIVGALAVAAAVVLVLNSPAGASRPLARAVLHNAAGARIGAVVFEGTGRHADRVDIKLELPADAPGLGSYHGLHVHAIGTCTAPAFTSAGGHWNLDGSTHGHHTGDLPSVLVAPDGTGRAVFETHRFDISQLFDGDGSAVVLHMGIDNFGNVPIGTGRYEDPNGWYNAPTGTANTGDAGSRYGCGVVEPR
jgi:Cu-Zn family superoxide dismutase